MIEKEKSITQMANPMPLGLAAFGIALSMVSFHYTTVIGRTIPVLALILTLGFIAPLLTGIIEFVKGNTFRATLLTFMSLFFLSLSIAWTTPTGATLDPNSMGIFYSMWAVVSAFLLTASIFSITKHWFITATLTAFTLFAILLSVAEFTQMTSLFITGGALGFVTSAIVLVDFIMHFIFNKK